ncbi:MAG: FAD-binding oxidoreductase [Deltaproteobacteria bacterium]|nr:FAD-binding oxidoreductase [Deltaproteobacteria bacterium]
MAEALQTMQDLSGKVAGIVGSARVFTAGDLLDKYSANEGCSQTGRPDIVAQVSSREQVQALVRLANECGVPVVPRSSVTGFYGGSVPEQGGIVIDMSGMKKILRIDPKNRWALFEPGVTYGELQAELNAKGMTALLPLAPHPDKSVITSCLEREPKLMPKHHLDETILTMELVLPTGGFFHTGSMAVSQEPPEKVQAAAHTDLCNFMGPGLDWFRLLPGSLGAYGIVTAMNVKIAVKPTMQKLIFFGFKNLQDAVEPWYHLLHKLIGDECLLLNSRYLALLLAKEPGDISRLQAGLPPYTIILNLTAGEHRPEEKMAYLEKAVQDAARIFQLQPMESLPHAQDAAAALQAILSKPWDDGGAYWKWRGRGASREVFFLTQLQRAPEFLRELQSAAAGSGYPISDMGLYLQPKQNGRAFYMEAGFSFSPDDPAEKARAEQVQGEASRGLVDKGAFFYRVYGPWTELVYGRTGNLQKTLKRIKHTLDPNNILNPGKLGF